MVYSEKLGALATRNPGSTEALNNGAADDNGEDFLFADEDSEEEQVTDKVAPPPWKVLIVDDDAEVHAITRVVLGDVTFEGRPLLFLSAYSGKEARKMLPDHPDLAAILLDVVMETDDAGLRLVQFIRDELNNHQVRIVLRTGQPGQAPERQVIVNYDINDYKAKSELTAQKLFTTTISALRSYQHIAALEHNRRGLEAMVEGSTQLLGARAVEPMLAVVAERLGGLAASPRGTLLFRAGSPAAVAAHGATSDTPETARDVADCLASGSDIFRDDHSVLALRTRSVPPLAALLWGHGRHDDIDRRMLALFTDKAAVGLDNAWLNRQLENAQRATVLALGKLAEYKDEDTGEHVKRIEKWSALIARELQRQGLFPEVADEPWCQMIGLASVLHDVGKMGIPDAILRKPARLDADEWKIMLQHAAIGGSILREAAAMVDGRTYLSIGADIAESHHEKFDGSGYPHGLKGDEIPLAARIVAVADVFDALCHKRPYKEPWPLAETMNLLREESGRHFDPRVIDAFVRVLVAQGMLEAE